MSLEEILNGINVEYVRTPDGRVRIKSSKIKPNQSKRKSKTPHSDIIAYVRSNPGTNVRRLSRAIGYTRYTTQKYVDELLEEGKLTRRRVTRDVKTYTTYYISR